MKDNSSKIKHQLHNKQRSFLKNIAKERNVDYHKSIHTDVLISRINIKENEQYLLRVLEIKKGINYSKLTRNFFALCTLILGILKYQDGVKINDLTRQINSLEKRLKKSIERSDQKQFENMFLLSNKYQNIKEKYELGYMVFGVKENKELVYSNFNYKDRSLTTFRIGNFELIKNNRKGDYTFRISNLTIMYKRSMTSNLDLSIKFNYATRGNSRVVGNVGTVKFYVEYIDVINDRPIFLLGLSES